MKTALACSRISYKLLEIMPRGIIVDGVWKTANGVCDRYEMTPKTGDFFPSYL